MTLRTAARVVGVLSLGLFACHGEQTSEAGPQPTPSEWPATEARAWHLEMHSRLYMNGDLDQPALDAQLSGTWRWTPYEGQSFHVQLVDPELHTSSNPDPRVVDRLKIELGAPLLVDRQDNGAVVTVQVPQHVSTFARSLLEGALGATQLVTVPTSASPWMVEEADSNGQYRATYTRADESVTKAKTAYVREAALTLPGGAPVERTTTIVSHHATFSLDEAGRRSTVDVEETLDVETPGLVGRARSQTRLTLSRLAVSRAIPVRSLDADLPAMAPARALDAPPPAKIDPLHRDAKHVGGRDLGTLRDAYRAAEEVSDERARLNAFLGLVGLFRLEPTAAETARDVILAGASDAQTLMTALGYASTAEAHVTLAGLVEDSPLDTQDRMHAMRSLAHGEEPTPRLIAFYERMFDHRVHGRQARLGLGSAARHLRERDQAAAAAAAATLVNALSEAKEVGQLTATLRAIGNSTAPEALGGVRPHLESGSATIRAAAVTAMRGMAHAEVDGLLAEALSDTDEVVRQSAFRAMRDRSPSPVLLPALAEAALTEPQLLPRADAVRTLASWLPLAPQDVEPALQAVLERENDQDVRAVAEQALQRQAG